MKIKSLYNNRRPHSTLLTALSVLALTPAAMGVVLVNFKQVGDGLRWSDGLVSAGTLANPTELTLDDNLHFGFLGNSALSDVVGSTESGDVLWTANGTNDTIEIGAIPEPTSITLLGLGAVGLLARRKR